MKDKLFSILNTGVSALVDLLAEYAFISLFYINVISIQSSVVLSAQRYCVCLTRRRRRVRSPGASPTCFKLYRFLSKLMRSKRFWRWYEQTNKNPFYILLKERVYNILPNLKLCLDYLTCTQDTRSLYYTLTYHFPTCHLKLFKKELRMFIFEAFAIVLERNSWLQITSR